MTSTSNSDASLSRLMRIVGLLLTFGSAFLLWADVAGTSMIIACLVIGIATVGVSLMPTRTPTAEPIRVRSRR